MTIHTPSHPVYNTHAGTVPIRSVFSGLPKLSFDLGWGGDVESTDRHDPDPYLAPSLAASARQQTRHCLPDYQVQNA